MKILVTGGTGFLGSACVRRLRAAGHEVYPIHRSGPDLRTGRGLVSVERLEDLFRHVDLVVHCAYPGTDGIATALSGMADLVHDQLLIDLHVIQACAEAKVRLVSVGSVCAYPEQVTYPTGEDQLWSGRPESWNEPYGQAKRMQISLLDAYRRQYGLQSTHLILGNLYGPGDRSGHVIPATIRKCLQAKAEQKSEITVWGSGRATREFLYIDDAAEAIVKAAEAGPIPEPVNIVSGEEVSIEDLAEQIALAVGYVKYIFWDTTKPDGQPRRRFSNAQALALLGWTPTTPFPVGLAATVRWMESL